MHGSKGIFLCKKYILNGLDNMLYNVYSVKELAKALWESLDLKYKIEDAGAKKLTIGRFLDYKMQDSKTVMIQVQEIQLIIHDLHVEGMILNEPFQVGAIIENLPPSWRDFKNYLKHKRKKMKLEELIVRLRIEEDNKKSKRRVAGGQGMHAKANIVEQGQGSSFNKKRSFLGKVSSKVSKEETRNSRASVILVGRRTIMRRTAVIAEIGLEKDMPIWLKNSICLMELMI